MSESKAVLRESRDQYKRWYLEEVERRHGSEDKHNGELDELREHYNKGIEQLVANHSESLTFHQLKYADLAEAVENVYGISVDTLLKAHEYKLEQARDGELQDAYTEAIYPTLPKPDPAPFVKSESKGKN